MPPSEPRVLGPAEPAGVTDAGLVVGAGTGDNMGAALGLGLQPGDVVVDGGNSKFTDDKVHAEIARLTGEGLFTDEEIGTTCCFATQDKVWVTAPDAERWEVYTVLADAETFDGGHTPATTAEDSEATPAACCTPAAANCC